MRKFLEDHKFKPEGRGGKFAGPTIRLFLKELCFDLGERLKAIDRRLAKQVVDFCLWSLYKMSVSKTLVSDCKRYIDDYKAKFIILYRRIGLMFTKGRKRGTRVHQVRLLRSSYLYNFSHLGFVPHKFDNVDGELDPLPPQHRHMDHSYCLKVYI